MVAKLVRDGKKVTVKAVRERSGAAQNSVSLLLRLRRQGVLPDAEKGKWNATLASVPVRSGPGRPKKPGRQEGVDQGDPRLQLAKLAREAKTEEEREYVATEACALVLECALASTEANAIKALLQEARGQAKERRASGTTEDAQEIFLCTIGGTELVRLYEGMISEERRARVLEWVKAQAEVDRLERPDTDTAGGKEAEEADGAQDRRRRDVDQG